MTDPAIEVVHVGSAARDITDDDPRGWRLGGGVTYAALTTARLGLRTAAVVGLDRLVADASELEQLREAGVELLIVHLAESPAFRNEETPAGRIQTCVAPGQPLPVVELPAAWTAAPAWSLVPVAGEVSDDWAAAVRPGGYLGVGWQGLLRELVAGQIVGRRPPQASALIRRADLVGVSLHDLAPGTAPADLGRLLHRGANLVVTDGQRGGRLLRGDHEGSWAIVHYEALPADREDDPTGAGDTFLGSLLASIIRPTIVPGGRPRRGLELDPDVDLAFAAAAASLVIEQPGLLGVADLAAVQERYSRRRGGRGVPSGS